MFIDLCIILVCQYLWLGSILTGQLGSVVVVIQSKSPLPKSTLSLIGCYHPCNTAVVGHCQWCNQPSFSPFHIVFSLSKLILSFTTFLSLDHSSHSLLFSFFFLLVSDMYLDLKAFFFSPSNFSRSPPPKSDQISAVGL